MKIMKKNIMLLLFFVSFTTVCYGNGKAEEDYYVEDIIIKTDLEFYGNNNQPEILLKTKDGCSQSEFKIRNLFYEDRQNANNILFANDYIELEFFKEKYFDLPYLDTLSNNFFEHNTLVFVLQSYGTGVSYKNERIEKKDGKYELIIELWRADLPWAKACLDTMLYLLKIPKPESI
jgi:hypothetical protein